MAKIKKKSPAPKRDQEALDAERRRTREVILNAGVKPSAKSTKKIVEQIKDRELSEFAHAQMLEYAIGVNEDRAVPEFSDGFKPVQRRLLWAAHKLAFRNSGPTQKSARLVGDCIGKYHPHGDTAAYGAAVNMARARYRLFDKYGNFGSLTDPDFAAMRYTNLKLSKFSELVFLDPFYMPMMKTVPNYDNQDVEPMRLVSLLPNLLLNSTDGIGYGMTSKFPQYTLESVFKALQWMIVKDKPVGALGATKLLEFTVNSGGVPAPGQDAEILEFHKLGVGKVVFDSGYEIHAAARQIHFTTFAPFSAANFDKRFEKLMSPSEVKSVNDESSVNDKYARIVVTMKPSTDSKALPQMAKKLAAFMQEGLNYRCNVTIRSVNKDDADKVKVAIRSTTVPEILNRWLEYRVKLEVSACAYNIKKVDDHIRQLQVMLMAVKNRDLIIKLLSKKLTDAELADQISKALKITVAEANFILDLKVRKLKALEGDTLNAEIAKEQKYRAELVGRQKNPKPYISKHLKVLQEQLKDYT